MAKKKCSRYVYICYIDMHTRHAIYFDSSVSFIKEWHQNPNPKVMPQTIATVRWCPVWKQNLGPFCNALVAKTLGPPVEHSKSHASGRTTCGEGHPRIQRVDTWVHLTSPKSWLLRMDGQRGKSSSLIENGYTTATLALKYCTQSLRNHHLIATQFLKD